LGIYLVVIFYSLLFLFSALLFSSSTFFSPGNQTHLWSSSMDFTLRVWSLETNTLIKTITQSDGGHTNQVTCLTKSEDSQYIISGGMDSMLIVHEAATATVVYKGNQGAIIASVSCFTTAAGDGESAFTLHVQCTYPPTTCYVHTCI
jgi:WD40 repeat protein